MAALTRQQNGWQWVHIPVLLIPLFITQISEIQWDDAGAIAAREEELNMYTTEWNFTEGERQMLFTGTSQDSRSDCMIAKPLLHYDSRSSNTDMEIYV